MKVAPRGLLSRVPLGLRTRLSREWLCEKQRGKMVRFFVDFLDLFSMKVPAGTEIRPSAGNKTEISRQYGTEEKQ